MREVLGRRGKETQYSIRAGKHIPKAERQRAPNNEMNSPRRGTATARTTVKIEEIVKNALHK